MPQDRSDPAWLALSRAPLARTRPLLELIDRVGDAAALGRLGGRELGAAGLDTATIEILRRPPTQPGGEGWLDPPDHHLLRWTDAGYPARLREIEDPPVVLYCGGSPALLSHPQVAVVGARRASPLGRDLARELAGDLVASGLVVTSGLASGIDAAAHEGALGGGGKTIAIFGCGPDRVYPAANRRLARRIENRGALVSEFAPGTRPARWHFPRRNRVISGLSLGVVVVEAAARSGSLITARLAAEQGREVFAVPGPVRLGTSRGCHALLRQGATLVESAADVLEELGIRAPAAPGPGAPGPGFGPGDDRERALLEHVGFTPTPFDELVRRTRLTPESLSSMLLEMELGGWIRSAPGGAYVRMH